MLCQVCEAKGEFRKATRQVEFSGTGPRTGQFFDHETLEVCAEHFVWAMNTPEKDEVVHEIKVLD